MDETQENPQEERDAFAYGSLGYRLPWAETGEGELLLADEAFETYLEWTLDRGFELWAHQEDALMDLAAGDSVILGTPTGSGKSLVGLGLAFQAIATGRTCWYTAPIKALVSEKFFDFTDVFGRDNVGMLTGDASINPGAPMVCCTAEVLANLALREGEDCGVDCVVMDEFHYFGDPERGWAWQVPLIEMPHAQFLLMSATLGDVSTIAERLEERGERAVDCILDAPRPVPLEYHYSLQPLETAVELALKRGEGPLYVVHFSQDAALASAQALASYGVAEKERRDAVRAAMKGTRFTTPFGKTLQRLLSAGVGVHHAGMLPRYRLLVERLAQQGLLEVICGTDTLGVGINVPIHTVLLTALTKFDGTRVRRLTAREFHQIAGRAGRAGFDTEGVVIAQAPEHEIENERQRQRAAGDPKKARKLKKKAPPKGFVGWSERTFEGLVEKAPETLRAHFEVSHAMVLSLVARGGDAWGSIASLVEGAEISDEAKAANLARAREILLTLIDTGVVVESQDEDGAPRYELTIDLPEDFALDQPLSPFFVAALDLLDREGPDYAADVISLAESVLEDPRQILRAQERKARDAVWAELRAEGVDVEERKERVAEVSWPKPLEELIQSAFEAYCVRVPWARDYAPSPKSVLRAMVETSAGFKAYVGALGISRAEGILLRYLSDAYHLLSRSIPESYVDERLADVIAWLGYVVHTTDSSLVDAWEASGGEEAAPPTAEDAVVYVDRHGLEVQVRNALFERVLAAAREDAEALGALDGEYRFGQARWQALLDAYFEAHEEIRTDGDARSAKYFSLDEAPEKERHEWLARQIFTDEAGDGDFQIWATIDLDATQEAGEVAFSSYAAGFIEDLLHDSDA